MDWLVDEFKKDQGIDLEGPNGAARLKEAAERAKIELSSSPETEINLPFVTADASVVPLPFATIFAALLATVTLPAVPIPSKVPEVKVIGLPGMIPLTRSLPPPLMVVVPENGLLPVRITSPVPLWTNAAPDTGNGAAESCRGGSRSISGIVKRSAIPNNVSGICVWRGDAAQ